MEASGFALHNIRVYPKYLEAHSLERALPIKTV